MLVLIPADDSLGPLLAELRRARPGDRIEDSSGGLVAIPDPPAGPPPLLAFARQTLPEARAVAGASIRAFADLLFDAIVPGLPDTQPWRLHVLPHLAAPAAGQHRCQLIRESLIERLQRQRRHLLRRLVREPHPFEPADSLVQLLLTDLGAGFLSVLPAPGPRELRRLVSPFPGGEIPVASDKAAPCRAFAKLAEAELRMGRSIATGETCVDLGASPGSWTYVALKRGARVIAVDRAPLRDDLMRHPRLEFRRGDAFAFAPDRPVDWLLCDVIAAPARSIDLVVDWCRRRLCRHFVVTIKFKGTEDYPILDRLVSELPSVAAEFRLSRLCANKNEVCVMGSVSAAPDLGPLQR